MTSTAEIQAPKRRFGFKYPMRWKLLTAFAGAFTVVFVIISIWVIQFTTTTAEQRLVTQLQTTAVGAAGIIDAEKFKELLTTVPAVEDSATDTGFGYPDSPLYDYVSQLHMDVHNIVENSSPYSYYKDPVDGKLKSVGSYGYFAEPQFGIQYKVPYEGIVNEYTYGLMEKGLTETVNQPVYTDIYGQWISTYTPIKTKDGEIVGALGVDLPYAYVNDTRSALERQIYVVLGVMYVVLLGVVLLLSSLVVRPVKRLTAAASRIADGEYDIDLREISKTRFTDEMFELAESFAVMAEKVASRERTLTQEVTRLKVEIDQSRREEAVKQITDNDDFAGLVERARVMRERLREE
jgi:HAMP domain-containing protein